MSKTCSKCKRQFDPENEFIEDYDMLVALDYYIEPDDYCPECLYALDDIITKSVREWESE